MDCWYKLKEHSATYYQWVMFNLLCCNLYVSRTHIGASCCVVVVVVSE